MGLYFLHFEDEAVKKDMPLVLQKIADYIIAFEKGNLQVKKARK